MIAVKQIQGKITSLQSELRAIEYTKKVNKLTLDGYDSKQRISIISKIQVLNEILMNATPIV